MLELLNASLMGAADRRSAESLSQRHLTRSLPSSMMASLLFDDLEYPSMLYSRRGEYAPAVRDLLDFAPQVARHHVARAKEQSEKKEMPEIPSQKAKFPTSEPQNDSQRWETFKAVASTVVEVAKPVISEVVKHQLWKGDVENIAEALGGGRSSSSERERKRLEKELRAEREAAQRREAERQKDIKNAKEKQRKAEEELERERRQKEKESKKETGDSELPLPSIATAAAVTVASAASLYAVYAGSQKYSEARFLAQFSALIEELRNETIPSARAWISERTKLGLPVPELVKSDLEQIEQLCELIDRLDDSSERKFQIPGYLATALGSATVAASYIATSLAPTRLFGYASLAVGSLWIVSTWGMRSASGVKAGQRMYARKVDAICDTMESERHKLDLKAELERLAMEEFEVPEEAVGVQPKVVEREAKAEPEAKVRQRRVDREQEQLEAELDSLAGMPSVSKLPNPKTQRTAAKLEEPLMG